MKGLNQILIGYPFDTLKTNIQNGKNIKYILQNKKLLYRGVKYPLIMNSIGVSALFGNYDYLYQKTNDRIIAGSLTGIASACIITPFDYRKQIMQMQNYQILPNTNINTNTNNNIYQTIKKYYRGFGLTLLREIISIPVYFSSFHYINDNYNTAFFAGGIAGVNSWIITYPIDTLKTRRQLNHYTTIKDLIKMGNLLNGLGITLLRSFIVNSCCLSLYSYLKRLIN